jgi:hypothetical protein
LKRSRHRNKTAYKKRTDGTLCGVPVQARARALTQPRQPSEGKKEQREEGRPTGKETKAKSIREKGTSNRKEHIKRKRLQNGVPLSPKSEERSNENNKKKSELTYPS